MSRAGAADKSEKQILRGLKSAQNDKTKYEAMGSAAEAAPLQSAFNSAFQQSVPYCGDASFGLSKSFGSILGLISTDLV